LIQLTGEHLRSDDVRDLDGSSVLPIVVVEIAFRIDQVHHNRVINDVIILFGGWRTLTVVDAECLQDFFNLLLAAGEATDLW
jgi:hypothetical protein